jgi:putative glutamine amidotransferase
LLLAGGADLSPSLYGAEPHPLSKTPVPERDALEQRLLREALAIDLPVLAICRGMQLFNVTHPGGTLHQHIEGHRYITPDKADPAHDVEVVAGTRLASIIGAGIHAVNSRHHQAVSTVGAGLIISARSASDSVVEALEHPGRRFAIAVQWHSENQVRRFPAQKALFDAFAGAL